MTQVAIIPARGGSKRIPRKNIVEIGGKPILAHTIRIAQDSGLFSDIIVSTEDAEIAEIAKKYGATVSNRPAELATDTAMEIDVYAQVLGTLRELPDFFCAIYPSAIFIHPQDLKNAHDLLQTDPKTNVVMGVSAYDIHPFKALIPDSSGNLSMVHPQECTQRSQTYPPYVASNGTFYWFRTAHYLKNRTYYPQHLKGYVLPRTRAVDIDTTDDLAFAQALYATRAS